MLLAGITVFGCPALLTAKPGDVDAQFHTGDGRLAWCMAQQPDGKWLVGCNYHYVAAGQTAIFRLLPDGGLDSGFNPPLFHSHVRCILVQPDGKILVGKEFNWRDGELHGSGLIRLLADGARDSSFHVNSTDST